MFTNVAKHKRIAGLSLGILICMLVCLGISTLPERFEDSASQAPVRTLVVTLDSNQREEFFGQLKKFADKYAFEYSVSDYGGSSNHFLVYMLGEKIKILTVGISDDSKVFTVRFYAPSPGDPKPDKELVDNLVADLKTFLDNIPNVIIIEKK